MDRFPRFMSEKSLFLVVLQFPLPAIKEKVITYVSLLMITISLGIKIFYQ